MTETTVVNRRQVKSGYHNIARPSKWGNPFIHLKTANPNLTRVETREESVDRYRSYMIFERHDLLISLPELIGKKLGCWCHPELCHGDVLLELIDLYEAGRICRQCGCSDNSACEEVCYWVEPGLCSACAGDPQHWPEENLHG